MSSYKQTVRSYVSTVFGLDLNPTSSSLNRIVQLYTWILFVITPVLVNILLWNKDPLISALVCALLILVLVFILKITCYKLHQFFSSKKMKHHVVPEKFPFWVAVRDRLRKLDKAPRQSAPESNKQVSIQEIKYSVKTYNSAGASLNGLIGDTSRNESRDDETYEVSKSASVVAPTHDLNQIEEEERFDPYQKEPDITKPSSVDTGLNEMNENRLKRQKGMRRKKTRSSQYIDQDELEPLHIPVKQAEVPVEPSVVVLRAKGSKFGEQNTDTSNSCTITNDQCRSDPERLSVSDNKLQVGELTENLKRTHGRRNMNTTLKSVLSESSVVDPDSQRRIHDGPKSAENVNEDHPASNLRRKNNQESVDIEQKDEIDQMFENICSQSNKWESDIAEFQQNAQEEDSWRTISADTTPFSSSQASRGREHTREQAQLILQHFLGLQSLRNAPNSETEQLVRDVMRIQSESRREQSARQELPSTSSFDLRPEPGTSRTRSFSSASNTAELIQSIHIDGRSQQTNTANLSQSICRSSRPMSGNSGNEEASSRNCQKWPGFAESYPQAVFPYYEIGASKMRLYYTPRQLNELMHEAKSLTEVFVSCFTAAVVAALTSLTGNSLRPLPIFGGAENSSLFGGISYLLLFFIGASAQYSVIKAPVPDTGKD